MAKDGFDFGELDKFDRKMLNLANSVMPRESKRFLNQEGSKLNKENKKKFKSKGLGIVTGNLKKGFRKGKVYKYKGRDLAIRAYNNSHHAHLLNNGWNHVARDGSERWVLGWNFIEEAQKSFEDNYWDDCSKFVDELIRKGL